MKKFFSFLIIFLPPFFVFAKDVAVRFGVSSVLSAGNTLYLYERLNDYISDKLGLKVELVSRKNYKDMNELIKRSEVDFASICSGAIAFLDNNSFRILVVPVVEGKKEYQSYLIVHKDFEYKDINSMEGKTVTFTDEISFSGTMYPIYYLKQMGIEPQHFFSKVFFTGSHDKSIYLVSKKVVDAAFVDSLIYNHEMIVNSGVAGKTKIVYESGYFPIPPIVASGKMNDELFYKIRDILTKMHNDSEGKNILKMLNIDRFDEGGDLDYSEVIKISNEVKDIKIINP